MNRKIILFLFSLSIMTCSCMVIKFESPLKLDETYAIYKSEGEFPVVFKSNSICRDVFNDTIYAVNASQFKNCIKSYSKSMVYIWGPNCTSENCYSFGAVQEYADKNGYELFIVMEKYSHEKLSVQIKPQRPLYSIDHNFYSDDMKFDRYNKKFMEELTGKEKVVGSYLFFLNGRLSTYSFNLDLPN